MNERDGSQRQAVIFDMDGVLVDSEPRHEWAFLEVVRSLGFRDRLRLRFADYIGRSDQDLWRDFVALHAPSVALPELLAMKRQKTVEILLREEPLFPGVPQLVKKLASSYRLAVASGSELPVIDAVLGIPCLAEAEANSSTPPKSIASSPNGTRGLRCFFDAVVTSGDVPRGKPAPDIFLRAAELLGVQPTQCWVIEDSKPGVAAGLAAGMRVIAITNTHTASELAPATHVVSSYAEIEQLLLQSR